MDRERRPLLRRPAQDLQLSVKTKLGLLTVLSTETLERIAFYGIVGNLVLFLNAKPLDWMSFNAASAMFIFTGVSYLSSIFGGWLADSYVGKFKSIILFMIIYLLGYLFFPALTWDYPNGFPRWCHYNGSTTVNDADQTYLGTANHSATYTPAKDTDLWQEPCSWVVFLSLLIIGIGNGGVKSNIAPFGADQVKQLGPTMTRVFFNWFYWCINVGALISLGVLAYVQQQESFKWGYIAPSICLAVALVVSIIGAPCYIKKPAGGSVLSNVFKVMWEGCRRSKSRRMTSNHHVNVDAAGSVSEERHGWLDCAKVRYGGSFHDNLVDDVKTLGKLLLVFLSLVPYWAVYFQMETTYPIQGLHMRLSFDRENGSYASMKETKFNIPAAWLSLFDVVFLLFLIPLFDRVIYPRLDKTGHALSLRGRIIIGMICATASVLVAGGLESYRLSVYWDKNNTGYSNRTFYQNISSTVYNAANVSVLAQIPQYALIGISEVFASVAGLELAYTSAPRSMVSLIMGLFWFSQGLGSFLGTALITIFRGVFFFSDDYGDINCKLNRHKEDITDTKVTDKQVMYECHLDYYFFVLAGLQLLAIALFILITWKLRIGQHEPEGSAYEQITANRSPRSTLNDSGITNDISGYSSTANSPNTIVNRNTLRTRASESTISSESINVQS